MKFPIETIAIGDELLTGTISDSNSTYVGNELMNFGHSLSRETAIPDNEKEILSTLEERSRKAKILFVFGGLGPTSDDRTVNAVCTWLGCKPKMHAPSEKNIEKAYRERGQALNPHALKQALYPEFSTPLVNSEGMAPGFHVKKNADLFFLPGVPLEMKAIFQEDVIPRLSRIEGFDSGQLQTRIWKCIGVFESQLQLLMDPVESVLGDDSILGYRTHFPENHLTLYYRGTDGAHFEKLSEKIEKILQPYCFTRGKEEMEEIVFKLLKKNKFKIAIAESCTAGLVGNRISRIAGASEILWGGVSVYQVAAKEKLLGISLSNPEAAVTQTTTREMAEKILEQSGTDVGASITGFLGPEGGSSGAPLGTVYCCIVDKSGKRLEKELRLNTKNRERTQWGAATHLLDQIRRFLLVSSNQ